MGGRYTFANGTGNQTQASLYLLSLNQSFALDGNLKGAAIHYTRALPESPYKGDGGCFLYDASTLYFYAGLEEAYKVDGLWGYDLSDNFWKPIGVGGGNFQVGIRRDGTNTPLSVRKGSIMFQLLCAAVILLLCDMLLTQGQACMRVTRRQDCHSSLADLIPQFLE